MSALVHVPRVAAKAAPEVGRIVGLSPLGKGTLAGLLGLGAAGALYSNREVVGDKLKAPGETLLGTRDEDGNYRYSKRRYALDQLGTGAGSVLGVVGAMKGTNAALKLLKRYPIGWTDTAARIPIIAGAVGGGMLARRYLGDRYSPQSMEDISKENNEIERNQKLLPTIGWMLGGGAALGGLGALGGKALGGLMKRRFNPKYEEQYGDLVRRIAKVLPYAGGGIGATVGAGSGATAAMYPATKKIRERGAKRLDG